MNTQTATFIAFGVDAIMRSLAQVGFLLMKLALHDFEAKSAQMGNKNKVDNVNSARSYCQAKWIIGLLFTCLTPICQAVALPFVDMSLLACNAATAIIANVILSTKVLGERFVCKYDLTALVLIATGVFMIVWKGHTDPVSFTGEEVRALIFSWRVGLYVAVCMVFFILDRLVLERTLRALRKFEVDAEAYDQRMHPTEF